LNINSSNKRLKIYISSLLLIAALLFVLFLKISQKNKVIKHKTNEKEVLLKELHHRVKNNLMLILSLIDFQKDEFLDDFHKEKLTDLQHRIEAIALVHQQMMEQSEDALNDSHDIEDYIQKIAQSLIKLHTNPVDFKSNIVKKGVQIDVAVPMGILINELISNSIKHAKSDNELQIILEIFEENNCLKIIYKDNGDVNELIIKKDNLGLFIIKNMIKQLNGQFEVNNFNYLITITPNN
jgi:two-component sensor histidine kinase